MKATPLENFSSFHETTIANELGWDIKWPNLPYSMQYNFNLHTTLRIHPKANLIFDTKDNDAPSSRADCCYCITGLTRWRLNISSYQSMDDFLSASIRWHRSNYAKSKKHFQDHSCEITFIENDWTEHAEHVYRLYDNVAERYQHKLYDLTFFHEIAKRPDYKLMCAWFEGKMFAVFILQEELPTLHSIITGLDYEHTSPSYAFSWMHYALIDHAIAAKKYQDIDVGFNSDQAKREIGYNPVSSRIDVYSKGKMTHTVLKILSRITCATIDSEAKLKFVWRFRN